MTVRLEPWGQEDEALLRALVGDPAMMEHLGGAETPAKIAKRQARYALPGSGMYKVLAGDAPAGSVGFWTRAWRGEDVYEMGWSVLPAFQGRGVAVAAAAAALDLAREEGRHRHVHAFPSPRNAPSNAICRRLGFTLLGEVRFEYPQGHFMQCHDWRLELAGNAHPPRSGG
jgi:RimJ/RimL family protein N-acetyltransferase